MRRATDDTSASEQDPEQAGSRHRPSGYVFITPVWGHAYTKLFVETSLPSQLAPGNLPAFADVSCTKYLIYTQEQDAEILRAAPVMVRLRGLVGEVSIELIEDRIVVPHDTMSDCYKRGIAMANRFDCAALFLNPDIVFADGSFATLRALSQNGHDVIMIPGIRTLKQRVAWALDERFRTDEAIRVSPRDLMAIALENLHPLAASSWWDEGESDLVPANLYWRVGTEGIVARCFHLHPILVHPQRKDAVFFGTVDDDFVPAACPDGRSDCVIADSDRLLAIELSDPGRAFLTGFRKGSVDDVVEWAEQFTNSRHRKLFEHTVRMHRGIERPDLWEEAERRADSVVRMIQSRMSRSNWRLLLRNQSVLLRRMVRYSLDRGLAEANPGLDPSVAKAGRNAGAYVRLMQAVASAPRQAVASAPWRLLSAYVDLVRAGGRAYAGFTRKVFGPEWRPHPWAWRYLYVRRLRLDGQALFRRCEGPVLLLGEGRTMPGLLEEQGFTVAQALVSGGGGEVRLLSASSSEVVPEASQGLVVLARALFPPRQTGAGLGECQRVLRPGGRLIVWANRIPMPSDGIEHEICGSAGMVARYLSPEFDVVAQRTQGGFLQCLRMSIFDWMKVTVARQRLPFLVLAPTSLVIMPFSMVAATLFNLFAGLTEALGAPGRHYVSSLTLAACDEGEITS